VAKGTYTSCPKCGARVTKEKLRRHVNTVHGDPTQRKAAPAAPAKPASTVAFPWRLMLVMVIAGALVLAGWWFLLRPQEPGGGNTGGTTVAVISTSKGTIRVELDLQKAPRTAGNFVNLARAGDYDSNRFHRVADNFVVQGGAVPGAANVAWEQTGLTNDRYTIAMARSGSADDAGSKDTATSQFFINLKDNANLDAFAYPYVVFGHVVEGQSVVDAIGLLAPPSGDGEPTETVTIFSVRIEG
jgi:cyclophilin family peptidyl-prolyl cis-trans isomerase